VASLKAKEGKAMGKGTVPTNETLEQKVARLEAELVAERANKKPAVGVLTLKVTTGEKYIDARTKEEKTGSDGAIVLYGLGRFPTTLYINQWEIVKRVLNGETKCKVANANPLHAGKEMTFGDFVKAMADAGKLSVKE
jgi:hypothetical protein